MPIYLKQSTASQEVPLGYFVDSTDANTEETGLTIANTDIKIWKTGATTLANKNSGGGTHISNGIYYAVLDATDTDTLGSLKIFCHPTGARPVELMCCVLSANVYDSLIGNTDLLDANSAQLGGTVQTGRDVGASVLLSTGTGAGQLDFTSGRVKADTVYWNAAAVSTPSTAGVPKVDLITWLNVAPLALTSQRVQTQVGAMGSNVVTAAAIANAAIDNATFAADVGSTAAATNIIAQAVTKALQTANVAGYMNGAVWVDTNNGVAGTVSYVNGIASNPSSTLADALTIAAALKIKNIEFINGSSVTLAGSMANYTLSGDNWTLALGGQNIAGAEIKGATISGISSGTRAEFTDCHFTGTQTVGGGDYYRCGFGVTTFTMLASSSYNFIDCFDDDPDTTTSPVFTFAASAVVGARNWRGAFQIASMASTNKITIDGSGRVIISDTSEGGVITVRGFFPPTTGGAGLHTVAEFIAHGGTFTQTTRYDTDQINAQVDDALNTAIPGSPTADSINERIMTMDTGVTLANGAHGGAGASLNLGAGATISNASGSALTLTSSGANGHGLLSQGNGTGSGITASGGGASGNGIYAAGDADGMGILAVGGDSALGLTAGIYAKSQSSGTPVGVYIEDGAIITDDAGTALLVSSTGGNGNGIEAVGNGAGGDLVADITGTLGTVTTLTNLPAAPSDWLTGAAVKADAVTKIQTGLATPTNITAGTITTVTNLTNAPGAGDFTSTMKTSLNAATPALSTGGVNAVADGVWDEVLTGATHNVPTSAGRRLRQLASAVAYDGTVVSSTSNTVSLDSGASSVDGAYDPAMILISSGAGVGQTRLILQYAGATRNAVVDRDWKINPALGDEFVIVSDAGREHVNEGLAQSGSTSSTIKLNASASPNDDAYIGQRVFIRSGTGQDQARRVASYNGTTKIATLTRTWDVTPDATSAYVMLPTGAITDADIAAAVPTVIEIRQEMDSNSTQLAAIVTDTGTTLPAQISALNNLSAAQVTAAVPTATQNAAATLAAAIVAPVAADVKKINAATVEGAGTLADPWGPA